MHTLSPNTLLRPVVSLGALVDRHEVVPGRRIWIKDTNGIYLYANRALASDAAGEIIGRCDADLPWSDRMDEYAAADAEAVSSPLVLRERVRAVANVDRDVITHKSPLLDHRGMVIGTLGIFDVCRPTAMPQVERDCRACAERIRDRLRVLARHASGR